MKFRFSPISSVPIWFFLLCCLAWGGFVVIFGWSLKSTINGSDASGWFGRTALEIAGFPSQSKIVLQEVFGLVSGGEKDKEFSVRRPADADYSGFTPIEAAAGIDIRGLAMRVDRSAIADGWRILVGAFDVAGHAQNAAALLSPDLKVIKVWRLAEAPLGGVEPQPPHLTLAHGFEALPDGSVIFTFDPKTSLQRQDACGKPVWGVAGHFHHAVTLDESGRSVWTFNGSGAVVEIDVADGQTLRTLALKDLVDANPAASILELRRVHDNPADRSLNSRNTSGRWLFDPLHLNDVDPLPSAIADRFEGFSPGDLLISSRSLNLVFVADPDTAAIKWWRMGATQRQHDPDWMATGEISILDNQMGRDFSKIVAIDPTTFRQRDLLDGAQNDFYTRIRGKHQILADGRLVVSSPQQGRAFEVSPAGKTVLDIVNLKPGADDTNYIISEIRWLPLDYFDPMAWECPEGAAR